MDARDVIVAPRITEKSMAQRARAAVHASSCTRTRPRRRSVTRSKRSSK